MKIAKMDHSKPQTSTHFALVHMCYMVVAQLLFACYPQVSVACLPIFVYSLFKVLLGRKTGHLDTPLEKVVLIYVAVIAIMLFMITPPQSPLFHACLILVSVNILWAIARYFKEESYLKALLGIVAVCSLYYEVSFETLDSLNLIELHFLAIVLYTVFVGTVVIDFFTLRKSLAHNVGTLFVPLVLTLFFGQVYWVFLRVLSLGLHMNSLILFGAERLAPSPVKEEITLR